MKRPYGCLIVTLGLPLLARLHLYIKYRDMLPIYCSLTGRSVCTPLHLLITMHVDTLIQASQHYVYLVSSKRYAFIHQLRAIIEIFNPVPIWKLWCWHALSQENRTGKMGLGKTARWYVKCYFVLPFSTISTWNICFNPVVDFSESNSILQYHNFNSNSTTWYSRQRLRKGIIFTSC